MIESITVITLLLCALNRVDLQAVFDRDGYESRRRALPGARLVKVLVVYQMIHTEKLRGLIRTITEHTGLQAGRDGGTQYLVQWRCPAGCRADGRGLDGGLTDLRAVAEADGQKVRPPRRGRCQSDQAVAARLQLG